MIRFTLAFILLVGPALAQQSPPTPEVQALHARLTSEINANLQCSTAVITLQAENARLQAEIDKLLKEQANAK